MNNVTRNSTRHGGEVKRGRPRKHADQAAKQRAYRLRQAASVPFGESTRVRHAKHGEGLVLHMFSSDRAYVAFPDRTWRDLPTSELTPIGRTKKIPVWADPEVRNLKKRSFQFPDFDKTETLATMEGVNVRLVRVYTKRTRGGTKRTFRDWSETIARREAAILFKAGLFRNSK